MERNEYIGSDVWPPKETRTMPYYLGQGNTLQTEVPDNSGNISYVYDPSDPFPSLGGTALGDSVGPALQNRNLNRKDQLEFESGVLENPIILLGPISASLWLSSEAHCTAFAVCLQDIFPDGKIVNIQEGIANVELQGKGLEQKEISLWATGYQLNPDHKLKVVVTSSWFPPVQSEPERMRPSL